MSPFFGTPFRSFDPHNTGQIPEKKFIKIMKSKENVSDEDINEMIAEYKGFSIGAPKDGNQEPSIIYKGTKRILNYRVSQKKCSLRRWV